MKENYDVIIVGAGPGGLSAALYTSRATLKTLVLEKNMIGGLIVTTTEIENYPGSEKGATGPSLTERMREQCSEFGTVFEYDDITEIKKIDDNFEVSGLMGKVYSAPYVIVSTGSLPRQLGVKGEKELRGRGVSYCATCDAGFFREKEVLAVGGGDSALKEALYLTKFAKKVTVIHRRDEFRASNATVENLKKCDKIEYLLSSVVDEIVGDPIVSSVKVKNLKTDEVMDYPVDGVFIFAGYTPNSSLVCDLVELNEGGYINTDERMKTSLDGMYSVGDVRNTPLRQVITAASDGAIAAVEIEKNLMGKVSY